jgi:phage recombination protein Bet
MSDIVLANASKLALTLGIAGNGADLVATLKATAFKGQATDAQLAALLFVASQYGLNPFTKEIYAFPDSRNGIVPVVGVDGWSRIINTHPQFDGMDFEYDAESCTCIIYRKDRSHPVRVTEFMEECKRKNVGPWESHPRRMLRHKAMIQAARLAFGYTGIFDQDEAERIKETNTAKRVDPETGEITAITFDVIEALNQVESAEGLDALATVWKTEGAKATAAKDLAGHAALKDAVKQRKAKLESETIIDAEVK